MTGPVCAASCAHESCWQIACPYLYRWVPVITVEPVSDELRARHGLPPGAREAVIERYMGTEHVCCTDLEAVRGTDRAARASAEACGAVYEWAA